MHLGPHLLEIVYSIHNYGKKKKKIRKLQNHRMDEVGGDV